MFDRQLAVLAFSRALANTGNRMAAKMAMIAITTSNSISVNPRSLRIFVFSFFLACIDV